MKTKIYIAADHAGVELKTAIYKAILEKTLIPERTFEIIDLGPHSTESVDFPDYADLVCHKLHGLTLVPDQTHPHSELHELGILICGSGQGMAMRANKYKHIRAALCWDEKSAALSREHNNANVLCLSARLISQETNFAIIKAFLTTSFAGGRHQARVVKIGKDVT